VWEPDHLVAARRMNQVTGDRYVRLQEMLK
jgi:hypothetical protein